MIEQNVQALIGELAAGNSYGEKITLVAATKTRTAEEINRAIRAGVTDVGENRVQEFSDKYSALLPCRRHFIGHLQTNKVKYLIGKTDLYHSIDRDGLATELARLSLANGITSDVLIQINIGKEASKGGYPLEEGPAVFRRLSSTEGLRVRGFMAMLPLSEDTAALARMCDDMDALFRNAKKERENVDFLSMGMSGDWRLCIQHGANMVRLGTALFGAR